MKGRLLVRKATPGVALFVFVVALISFSAVEPLASRVAEAQDQIGETAGGLQTPPLVPEIDYSDTSGNVSPDSEAALGTPAVPGLPSDAAKIPAVPEGGTTTASLGGSDVAVASVGGSYQVDAPHKKKRRSPVPAP